MSIRFWGRSGWHIWTSPSGPQLPARWWAVLVVFAVSSVVVAGVGVMAERSHTMSPDAQRLLTELELIPALATRPDAPDYERSAFGAAWTDNTDALGAGNGCDTRNDILARDLQDTTFAVLATCARAVATGEFRSPYSGRWITFRRGQGTGARVQIDHIVPLSFAWDMGARTWKPAVRQRFANDPANLVAVDGDANQDKGDQQPSRWMPDNTGFHCRYAVQFVVVVRTYGLYLDAPSVPVLRSALRRC